MRGAATLNTLRKGGLFTKYVASFVGLVVIVLAVNGATETWFMYRETTSSLIDTMAEKADATARRVEQFMSETERQISWVTRASAGTVDQRRADYTSLLRQVPALTQLFFVDGSGREQLRLTRSTVSVGNGTDFSRATGFSDAVTRGIWYGPAFFRDDQPLMTIAVAHSGRDAGVTVAEINLKFLSTFVSAGQAGRVGTAFIVDPKGELLASSDPAQKLGTDLSALPQIAAVLAKNGQPLGTGTSADGQSVLSASRPVPDLGWFVFYEQPRSQALLPIRNLLLRVAGLVILGLLIAAVAGTLLARRMLLPIRALQAGAHRLGSGDFGHRIEVKTSDELEDLSDQFNSMAGQLHESYSRLEQKVDERTRDLAQSVRELKVLEEVGRAVSSTLELEAVLRTVASKAVEITNADAVSIYGYDSESDSFRQIQAIGVDGPSRQPGPHLVVQAERSLFAEAARKGEPIEIADLAKAEDYPLKDVALAAGFHALLVVPLTDQEGILGALVLLRKEAGDFPPNVTGLMQTFAHQSVLAMRNARLFHEVDHKGRELALAHDTVQQQASKLREQTDQLLNWNKSLEERVSTQLAEIARISRLERFLAPQVAQLVASSDGGDAMLASHRGEVTVVFCDLRGFTAFTESVEPEEVMNVLREYHTALGELIFRYEGTLDRFAGDGVMVLFNAPVPLPDHTKRAVRMAVEMRDRIGALSVRWRNRGHTLGFGIGIAMGYATLGQIGFDQRLEYAAVGSVTNLASRLCDEAKAGQIVVSQRAYGMVEQWADATPLEDLSLKGFNRPIAAVEILRWRDEADDLAPLAASTAG